MKETVILKVGDKVICDSQYHGLSINTVERITKTTAVLNDDTKLPLQISFTRAKGSTGYGSPYYSILTPELLGQYNRQQYIRKISKTDLNKVDTEKLKQIVQLLTP